MKYLLFKTMLAILFMMPVSVLAQKCNFGFEAGYVNNTLAVEDYESTSRNGFKIGANAEYSLRNDISFELGVAYVRKGADLLINYRNFIKIYSIQFSEMDYLQIPLMVGYKFKFGDGFSIKPEAGGYFSLGIGGDSFYTKLDNNNKLFDTRVKTFKSTMLPNRYVQYWGCNRSDAGLSAALNVNCRHFTLKAEYDLGLANTTYYGNGKQRTLSISLGYWIY